MSIIKATAYTDGEDKNLLGDPIASTDQDNSSNDPIFDQDTSDFLTTRFSGLKVTNNLSEDTCSTASQSTKKTSPSIAVLDSVFKEMRGRIDLQYPDLLASLDRSDVKEKIEMWKPSEESKEEIFRDVQLVMSTIFPNPQLEQAMWDKLNEKKLVKSDRHEKELKDAQNHHRNFLIRYILLLHHSLSYREHQSSFLQKLTWDLPLACVLCHGGRVLIEVKGGDARQLLSVLFNGELAKSLNFLTNRRSSHDLKLIDDVFHEVRACYVPCHGFNLSFGGLGNPYDYQGGIIGPGGIGLPRNSFRKALDYFSGRQQQGHVLVSWKNDTMTVDEQHVPIGAILVGVETVDYRYKSGFFGQGHSCIGLSNERSVSNGKKMAKFFVHRNKARPSELGGIRSFYHVSNISPFQEYCQRFFKLNLDQQKVFLMAALIRGVETEEEEKLGFPPVYISDF